MINQTNREYFEEENWHVRIEILPSVFLDAVQTIVGQSPQGSEGGVVVTSFKGGTSSVTNLECDSLSLNLKDCIIYYIRNSEL